MLLGTFRAAVGAALLLATPVLAMPALAQSNKTIGQPSAKPAGPAKVDSLIVLNANRARLTGDTLVLEMPQSVAILFSDRPVRKAGHISTVEVVDLWKTGSFAKDPPNATISVFVDAGASVKDAVVVLKQPRLLDGNLAFDVKVLEGDLGTANGPASLFIDTVWFGIGSGGVSYLGATSNNVAPPDPAPSYSGWRSPSLATPPDIGGGSPPPAACGAPPLLPCY